MPTLISDRFEDYATKLVHLGEKNERDARSEWLWFACGKNSSFAYATEKPVSCMGCAAGVVMHDWMKPEI